MSLSNNKKTVSTRTRCAFALLDALKNYKGSWTAVAVILDVPTRSLHRWWKRRTISRAYLKIIEDAVTRDYPHIYNARLDTSMRIFKKK